MTFLLVVMVPFIPTIVFGALVGYGLVSIDDGEGDG